MNIDKLINNPLNNLTQVYRFSGQCINKPESDSEHVWMMNSMALVLVPELNKKYTGNDEYLKLDIKDIIYRIVVHDLDESITSDIPRPFKYHNTKLKSAIDETVDDMMKSTFSSDLVHDINNAKDSSRSGYLVKLLDVIQVLFKYRDELVSTGNRSVSKYVPYSLEVLDKYSNELAKTSFDKIYKDFITDLVDSTKDYIKNIFGMNVSDNESNEPINWIDEFVNNEKIKSMTDTISSCGKTIAEVTTNYMDILKNLGQKIKK